MERRKSPRSKRPIQSVGSSHETSDDEISSGSKSTTNSRRSSPKKIKRDNRKAIVQSINWKCSPQRIAKIIKKLTPRQVQWVKDMGFQSVLDMHPYKLPRRLLLWLVKHVDCKTKSLVLRNRKISILDAVQNILQFPAGEIEVQMPPAGNPRDKAFMKLDKFRSDKAGRGQTLAEEEKELLSYKNPADKDKFCLSFMEVLLCGYLAPTTCYNINRSYLLGALSDMSQVPLMNWCHFAVDYLIRDIRDTRTKTVRYLNLQGCLHILIVMFVDLVKNIILSAPPGTPRIKYITSDMIDQLETNCRKRDRDDEELFESLLLAKFPIIESNDICEEEESSSNAQADSNEQNEAEPSRRSSRVMSNNEINREDLQKNFRSSKVRRLNRTDDEIFLQTCKDNHWIAVVVNFTQNALEVYDSKSIVKEGEECYKSLLKNMTANLQKAYSQARRSDSINIEEMKTYYNIAGIQDNTRDCGYYVLRVLQCHNGKELVGNCKISIDLFRKEICYALINHKFNDLNPNRPEILALREDEETTSE